jgi:hypothetical protein
MSTGPVTIEGKRRCYAAGIGAWLAAGNRPHRGPNRTPAERARIADAKLRRRKAWGERRDRKRERQAHKERKAQIAAGLPYWTDEEVENL